MTSSSTAGWPMSLPLWWRVPAWAGMTAATAALGSQHWFFSLLGSRITGGVLMAVAVLALQFTGAAEERHRRIAVLLTTVAGLLTMAAAPGGLGMVPVFIAAARIPQAFSGTAEVSLIAADTVVTGAAMGWATHSWLAVFSGAVVPLVAQRSAAQREIVAQRDRAQALLVEAQAGRDAATREAALRERGRIARDMHDVLAHSLAGLSLQLQATRAVAANEGVSATLAEALDKASTLARDGLTDAREAVATLRDPGGLGLDELPALVERHPGLGALHVDGTAGTVSPAAGHAVYRAVQESLTNAARYAPGSAVDVGLSWQPDRLSVTVDDAGPGPGHQPLASGQGSGLGLTGMAERVHSAGGTVQAGPGPRGGWRVFIEVPAT